MARTSENITPSEIIWVEQGNLGDLRLVETTKPSAISGTGQVYAKSDHNLYYLTGTNTEYQLTPPSGGSGLTIGTVYGGTNADSSGSTGVAQVSSGTWSFSTALANGTTATTQSASDNSTKVATTAYVTTGITNALNGLDWKPAVGYASTANQVATNVAGVMTYVSTGVNTIDGHTLALNDQVLLKNQTTQADNGIWVVTTAGALGVAGVLTRRSNYNTAAEIQPGDAFYVLNGTVNANTTWVETATVVTINSDAITFSQASGPGSIVSGNGITVTGNSVAIDTSVTVDKTTVQTLTNKTLTGPVMTSPALGTPASGVMTNVTGLPAAAVLAGSLGTGAYVMDTKLTVPQVINTANTVTVSSNAGTVPITSRINNFTNSSASAMTITMATASAVDGQLSEVRIYDASAATKGITWVNTENSTVTAPTTSNGSTTLPLSVIFQYNGSTSLWRCLASS